MEPTSVTSAASDLLLYAPTSILGFVSLMMLGVFYLVKYFMDMQKDLVGNMMKGTLDGIQDALQNNTHALHELQALVRDLMKDRHEKTP